jgi:hypothetical protein
MAKDDKKGKKQGSPDDIMSISEIRPLLKLAKGGKPVSAVVGLSGDGEAVLLMHKQAAPKKLRSMLIKQAQDAGLELDVRSVRFGRASTDEGDEGVLKLTVNREPSGSALYMQVKKRVKPAGFGDVIFITDPSIESESEDGGEAPAPGAAPPAPGAAAPPPAPPPQAPAPAPAPEASAAPPSAPEAPEPPPAPPAPPAPGAQQAPAGPDMSQLTRRLASLIPQVASAAAPPPIKAALGQLAAAAGAAVKNATNDAEGLVDRLDDAIRKVAAAGPGMQAAAPQPAASAPPAAPPPPPQQPSAAAGPAIGGSTFARSQKAWLAARKRIEDEIAKLHDGVQAACEEHGIEDVLRKSFETKVEPMLDELDDSLAEKLGQLDGANDPAQHAKLLGEAKQIIARYQAYVNGNPMIAQLDSNPFVPVAIHKTITATLAVLSNSVR